MIPSGIFVDEWQFVDLSSTYVYVNVFQQKIMQVFIKNRNAICQLNSGVFFFLQSDELFVSWWPYNMSSQKKKKKNQEILKMQIVSNNVMYFLMQKVMLYHRVYVRPKKASTVSHIDFNLLSIIFITFFMKSLYLSI